MTTIVTDQAWSRRSKYPLGVEGLWESGAATATILDATASL
jgi:hypothetical protein